MTGGADSVDEEGAAAGTADEAATSDGGGTPAGAGTADGSGAADAPPAASPLYKGEPLDADRGPGLGCFWAQVILLGILLVLTPLTVWLNFPPAVSAVLLIVTLVLLLFAGQTVIFLLRLVAADRKTRRVPRSATARKTVGMLEEEGSKPPHEDGPTAS